MILELQHFSSFKDFQRNAKRSKKLKKPKIKRRKRILKSNKLSLRLETQKKNETWDSDDETDSTSEFENIDDSGESFLHKSKNVSLVLIFNFFGVS